MALLLISHHHSELFLVAPRSVQGNVMLRQEHHHVWGIGCEIGFNMHKQGHKMQMGRRFDPLYGACEPGVGRSRPLCCVTCISPAESKLLVVNQ